MPRAYFKLLGYTSGIDDDDDQQDWKGERGDANGLPVDDKVLDNDTISRNDTASANIKEETRKPRRPRGCGTTAKTKTRIVGGQPADPKEWPWMAALLRQSAIQFCGGVLITDRHVLTAAHCVHGYACSRRKLGF